MSLISPFWSYRFDDPTTSVDSASEFDVTDGDTMDASDLSSMIGFFSRKTGETRRIFDLSMLWPREGVNLNVGMDVDVLGGCLLRLKKHGPRAQRPLDCRRSSQAHGKTRLAVG